MLRILRAFAWMRWRIVLNSLERTGARDTVERLSIAIEQIGPLVAALLLIPSAVGLSVVSGYAGWALATSADTPLTFQVVRYLLLAAVALSVAGPIFLPASERTNAVRLLLLPIPRRVLYVAQAASTLTDPWILLAVPMVAALTLGLVIGGAPAAGAVALVSGALFLLVLIGLSSLTTTVVHLLVRDRRRGELLALLFILVVPMVAMAPGLMHGQERRAERSAGRRQPRTDSMPVWVRDAGTRAFAVVPSELLTASVRLAPLGALAAARPVATLLAVAAALHGLAMIAFGRVLDSPGSSGGRRASTGTPARVVMLPGMAPGASAVAMSQVRLALRSPRGRSILISPLGVIVMFSVLMLRSGGAMELGFIELHSGLALATCGAGVCLLAILPFAMNQFAIDRAGLTLQLLSPLSDRDILIGKAVGNGLIAGVPALVCVTIAYLLFPAGPPALWLSVPLGVISTYILAAPAAAALSAVFPRAVDLNSIGQRSNAHGLAGLLGMLAFAAAGAPAVLLATVAGPMLNRQSTIPLILLLWCAIALLITRLLLHPVSLLFHRRRETLGMIVR